MGTTLSEPHEAYEVYENKRVELLKAEFGENYEDAACGYCAYCIEMTNEQLDKLLSMHAADPHIEWEGEGGICTTLMSYAWLGTSPCDHFEWADGRYKKEV